MFDKEKFTIESLPPTADPLSYHLMRCDYQALIWKIGLMNYVDISSPDGKGWTINDVKLTPVLMSLQSVPKFCQALVICSCKKGCKPNRYGYLKTSYLACNCEGLCMSNTQMNMINKLNFSIVTIDFKFSMFSNSLKHLL